MLLALYLAASNPLVPTAREGVVSLLSLLVVLAVGVAIVVWLVRRARRSVRRHGNRTSAAEDRRSGGGPNI